MPRPRKTPPRPGPRGGASVLLRLTLEERETLRAAAERDERPLGAWLRRVALAAARSPSAE